MGKLFSFCGEYLLVANIYHDRDGAHFNNMHENNYRYHFLMRSVVYHKSLVPLYITNAYFLQDELLNCNLQVKIYNYNIMITKAYPNTCRISWHALVQWHELILYQYWMMPDNQTILINFCTLTLQFDFLHVNYIHTHSNEAWNMFHVRFIKYSNLNIKNCLHLGVKVAAWFVQTLFCPLLFLLTAMVRLFVKHGII